jgi:TetR/AcrR family transcriptional repressor of nem operon
VQEVFSTKRFTNAERICTVDLVSTETTADRHRGRPREFDEAQVLDAVIDLFWTKGYEAASLADMVEASGLNKSSLYNAFGSKDEIYDLALARYLDGRQEMVDQFTMGDRGLEDLLEFFEFVRLEVTSESGRRGCLAINSSTELGNAKPTAAEFSNRYRTMMCDALHRPIERAAALGEIDPELVDVYADACVSFLVSASVAVRGGVDAEEVSRQVDSMRRLVDTWRLDRSV